MGDFFSIDSSKVTYIKYIILVTLKKTGQEK